MSTCSVFNIQDFRELNIKDVTSILTSDDRDCYRLLAEIKWIHGFVCKSKHCRAAKSKSVDYKEVTKYGRGAPVPFSRKCLRCKVVETPTANTNLAMMKIKPTTFFDFAQRLLDQRETGRITDQTLYIGLKSRGHKLSLNTVSELRKLVRFTIQPFDLNSNQYDDRCPMYFETVEYRSIDGAQKKTIIIGCQTADSGFRQAKIYEKNGCAELLNSLTRVRSVSANPIHLFGVNKVYPSLVTRFPTIVRWALDEDAAITSIFRAELLRWLTDLKPNLSIAVLQGHIDEFLYIRNTKLDLRQFLIQLIVFTGYSNPRKLKQYRKEKTF